MEEGTVSRPSARHAIADKMCALEVPQPLLGTIEAMGRYIYARGVGHRSGFRTKLWFVTAKSDNEELGSIQWTGKWRCYAFFPFPNTYYEKRCLKDIADFCEARTKEHFTARKNANARRTPSAAE